MQRAKVEIELTAKEKRRFRRKERRRFGKGKRKGSAFERDICKTFSLWVSKGERDDIFWRSAMSGGRATLKFKRGLSNKTQVGDLTAIDPLGEPLLEAFMVECKCYRDIQLDRFILMGDGPLYKFWREAKKASSKADRDPMLVVKQGNVPAVVITYQFNQRDVPVLPMPWNRVVQMRLLSHMVEAPCPY